MTGAENLGPIFAQVADELHHQYLLGYSAPEVVAQFLSPWLSTRTALRVADLELNRDTREVHRSGELIDLTPKEYAVLEYLMRHQGRVMSRTLITEYAWGYHFDPGTNIVDVVINHLRKKIDAKHDRKLITTVRGVGYVVKG